MAWHPKASPWDWDSGDGLLQVHGGKRSPESGWASEPEACLAMSGGAQNGAVCSNVYGLGSSGASFSSASSSLHGMLASGVAGESNFAGLDQRRLPVTNNAGAGSSFNAHCRDDSPGSGPQNREKAEFLGLRSQPISAFVGHKKVATTNTEKNGSLNVAPDRYRQKSEPQGSIFLPAGQGGQDDKEGTRAHSTEEQHSSTATGSAGSGDSLTGLHLGKRTYFEDATGSAATKGTQKPPLGSNSTPPKRPRAASGGGVQTPRCQVEGCKIDLTSAKGYHRRHKVCEVHSKAEKVTVANQEQRFCQQCSRFHVLAEFDEVKRSCRRRLAGHNERRRKPQPHTFALNARFPSAFQEWPSFFRHPRFMGMSAPWEDSGKLSSLALKGAWPRMMRLEDQRSFDCTAQASGMERQLFLAGLSPQPNDKLPLLLLQSPKGIICMPNDQRAHGYLAGSIGPMNNGLTLSCSSGAGVLSGLEVTPAATQVVTKVTDSGRALSLLSAQTPGSTAPDAVSLDLSTGTSVMVDQFMSEDHTAGSQQLLQGGQQHYFDYAAEKMLSIASNFQNQSFATSVSTGGMSSMEKDHYSGSLIHDLNGTGSSEGHTFLSTLQGHETRVPQDTQILSLPQSGHLWGSSMAFTSCPFEELQSSYEPSFLDSQQRI